MPSAVRLLFGLFFGSIIVLHPSAAMAMSSSRNVSLTVPDSTVTIRGRSAPFSLVTIKENGVAIATTSANNLGYFSRVVNRAPGLHTLHVYYLDSDSIQSAVSKRTVSVSQQQNTDLNLYLAPTISRLTNVKTIKGALVQIRGQSYVGSQISLNVDNGARTFSSQTTSDGSYEFYINSRDFTSESHRLDAVSSIGIETSDVSFGVDFVIVDPPKDEAPKPSEPSGDIIVSPEVLMPPAVDSPEDGAVINRNEVEIKGTSRANAQINVFQNGELFSSIFSDDSGNWSLLYRPGFSPVTLTFQQCLKQNCSAISKAINLSFPSLNKSCSINFKLEQYRFFDIQAGQKISFKIISAHGAKDIEIDWGDDTNQTVSISDKLPLIVEKAYDNPGFYSASFRSFEGNNPEDLCSAEKRASAEIIPSKAESYPIVVLLSLAALITLFGAYQFRKSSK